jgi:pyridoxal/pyridoxine/pyridoxamine kinase
MMSKLEQMLPNGTLFELLDETQMMDSSDFKKKIRKMRKPKVSGFVVISNTDVMSSLSNVVRHLSSSALMLKMHFRFGFSIQCFISFPHPIF